MKSPEVSRSPDPPKIPAIHRMALIAAEDYHRSRAKAVPGPTWAQWALYRVFRLVSRFFVAKPNRHGEQA